MFLFLTIFSLFAYYPGESISTKLSTEQYKPKEECCRIFLIRHGQTDWNVQGKSQGWEDIPLNQEGIRQSELIAESFADLDIAAIYSSVLIRATATSEIVGAYHPMAKIVYDPALRFYDPNKKKPPAGLTVEEVDALIAAEVTEMGTAYLKKVAAEHKGQNVIIITHGKVIKHLLSSMHDQLTDHQIKIENGSMIRVLATPEELVLESDQ